MTLTCDDVELLFLEGPLPADAAAHLAGCARCQAFATDAAQVLSLAALGEPTGAERAKLVGLAPRALAEVRARQRRLARGRWAASLAVAAGLGALVAGLTLRATPKGEAPPGPRAVSDAWQGEAAAFEFPLAFVDDDATTEESDDLAEVAWPNPNEGEAP